MTSRAVPFTLLIAAIGFLGAAGTQHHTDRAGGRSLLVMRANIPSDPGTDGLHDSPMEGNGFESSVPRKVGSGFEASVGLGIDRRRGGIIRVAVGLGKLIELFRRLEEPPVTAE